VLKKSLYALAKSSLLSRRRNAATDSWSSRSDARSEFHIAGPERRSYEGRSRLFLWLVRRGRRVQLIVGIGGWGWQRPADTCWANSWVIYSHISVRPAQGLGPVRISVCWEGNICIALAIRVRPSDIHHHAGAVLRGAGERAPIQKSGPCAPPPQMKFTTSIF